MSSFLYKTTPLFAALSLAVILYATAPLHAEVSLPALFSDNMVLQADAKIPVWGWAAAGEDVNVTLGTSSQKAKAGADGQWKVEFPPLSATATPVPFAVKGTNQINFKNVVVGEVWICSGQSNMYFSLDKDADAATTIPQATDPRLRLFKVVDTPALQPNPDVKGAWKECTPESVKRFSAVAYYFGKNLRADLKCPVGLIFSSVGGSIIQAWMSLDSLKQEPAYPQDIARWQSMVDHHAENVASYPQRQIDSTAQMKQWEDEVDTPFKAATATWEAAVQQARANHQPLPPRPVLARPGPPRLVPPDGNQATPTVLYNGMISPLIPFAIKGVLWYQGEGNTKEPGDYHVQLPRMIADWRARWGQGDFPFIIVQLPFFHDPSKHPVEVSGWSMIREAEFKALAVPQTGMAVALDQGNPRDVHPTRKMEVGHRASLAARQVAYGEKIVGSGPLFAGMKIEGNQARISFTSVGAGLVLGPSSGSGSEVVGDHLLGFAIAGADKQWVAAEAKIDGETVVVSSPGVANPVAVRYGWSDNPPCNLFNKDGLPASSFRTDEGN